MSSQLLALLLVIASAGCSRATPAGETPDDGAAPALGAPDGGPPEPGGGAGHPRCPDPKPDPTWVCAQGCPPRIARPGDSPPGYVWADPRHVRSGKVYPCPICLPEDAGIATPDGPVRAADVREGMVVWSQDAAGRRIPARVVLVGSTPVVAPHMLVRIALGDGRAVRASAGHPTAEGEPLARLSPGDRIDGASVTRVERVPYLGARTVDLLPDTATGVYWADGVPLRSTLRRHDALAPTDGSRNTISSADER
jgi:hypothetical protein